VAKPVARSHQRALNRNDSDKGENPPQATVLEAPHVQVTSNDHILLLAHHRVTTEVRVCRGRDHPRGYAADAKLVMRMSGGVTETGRMSNGERKNCAIDRGNKITKDKRHAYLERL
jgi:hypothetical protein